MTGNETDLSPLIAEAHALRQRVWDVRSALQRLAMEYHHPRFEAALRELGQAGLHILDAEGDIQRRENRMLEGLTDE